MADKLSKQIKRRAKKLNAIAKKEVPRAAAKALNDTIKIVRTKVVRGVAKRTKIQSKHIRKKVFISRATARKQISKLYAYAQPVSAVSLMRSATLLKNVRRGTNRRGVRVAGRQFNRAFINVHRASGRFQVYRREGLSRLPLEVVKIPLQREAEREMKAHSAKAMQTVLRKKLLHELRYRTKKYTR